MVTCLGDTLFPDVGVATVRLLRRLGVTVDFPIAQTCCGQPQFNSGYHHLSSELAKHAINTFANSPIVVTPSGSCAAMVKLEYAHLFEKEPEWKQKALDLAAKTYELSDFLINVLKKEDVGARYEAKVTYHMACHLRGINRTTEAIRLLENVQGLTYIPMTRHDECCGFGGSFAVRYPGISGAMVRDKCDSICATEVDAVVATDAGCLMNIGGYLHRNSKPVKTVHLAEVLVNT